MKPQAYPYSARAHVAGAHSILVFYGKHRLSITADEFYRLITIQEPIAEESWHLSSIEEVIIYPAPLTGQREPARLLSAPGIA